MSVTIRVGAQPCFRDSFRISFKVALAITRRRSIANQTMGDWPAKLQKPAPGGFIGNIQTALRERILNIPVALCEESVEPYCMADNFRWEGKALCSHIGMGHLEHDLVVELRAG